MTPADSTLIIGKHPLKVRLVGHRGRVVMDLRWFYSPAAGGPLKPGKRGVTIEAAAIDDVLTSLEKLKAQMVQDGFLEYSAPGSPPKVHPNKYPSDF